MNKKENNILIPELRFPEFKNDGEWVEKKLGEVGGFVGGGTPNRSNSDFWIGDIPWISSSDIIENDIHNISISRFINKKAINHSATKLIPKGSILFVSRVGVGKLAVNKIELCTSQDFTNYIPKKILNYFIAYYFLSKKYLLQSLNQGTSIKGFTIKDLDNFIIQYPKNKQEQQKIAALLSNLDELIDAHKQKLELLKQHKKGLMQNLFPQEGDLPDRQAGKVPKFRFPEFRNDGEWKFLFGNELFQSISNKNHNSDLPILAITQEHGAIPRDEIDYTVIATKQSVKSYKIVEVGDFIISLRSFQGGIEYSNYKGICSPAYIILRKKKELSDLFFKFFFKTDLYIRYLNKKLEGIRDGKMVSYKQFSEILLPYPSLKEQQKIADCLSSLDELITAQAEKIEQFERHKKGLMQRMFPAIV